MIGRGGGIVEDGVSSCVRDCDDDDDDDVDDDDDDDGWLRLRNVRLEVKFEK